MVQFEVSAMTSRPPARGSSSPIDQGNLFVDDIYAWNYVERAIELAAAVRDPGRLSRAKAILFKFRARIPAGRSISCRGFFKFRST
jgi:hypothetical protein